MDSVKRKASRNITTKKDKEYVTDKIKQHHAKQSEQKYRMFVLCTTYKMLSNTTQVGEIIGDQQC